MAYRVSPKTARRVLLSLEVWGTAAAAAHQIEIGLRAIEPYSDAASERALACLRKLQRLSDEKRPAWMAKLAEIAEEAGATP